MLLEELSNLEENRNLIIDAMIKSANLKVKRITYIAGEDYGSGVNLYITVKDKKMSALESFMGLWLKNTIWEEELEDFSYSKEECMEIFDNLFVDVASEYELTKLGGMDGAVKLAKAVSKEIEGIKKSNVSIEDPDSVGFLDECGIYVNRKYVTKQPLILKNTDEIIDGIELFSNDILGDYAELFLESKERYIYFF